MHKMSVQNVIDWLDFKGFLQSRSQAEVSLLCKLNANNQYIYLDKIIFFLSILCVSITALLLAEMKILGIAQYHNNLLSSMASITCSMILFNFIKSSHLYLEKLITHASGSIMLLGNGLFLLCLYSLDWGAVAIIPVLLLILTQHLYLNIAWLKVASGLLNGLYLLTVLTNFDLQVFVFHIFALLVFIPFLFPSLNAKYEPWLKGLIFAVLFESVHLIHIGQIQLGLNDLNYLNILLFIAYSTLMISHLVILKKDKHIAISQPFLLFSVFMFSFLSVIHLGYSIALLVIISGYKTVNKAIMTSGLCLLLGLTSWLIYSANMSFKSQSILVMLIGVCCISSYYLMREFDWHLEG